jgi:hypothetical protein
VSPARDVVEGVGGRRLTVLDSSADAAARVRTSTEPVTHLARSVMDAV